MPPTSLLLAAILAAGAAPDPHRAEIEAWRAQRVERLKLPDGWLSLVGLDWIEPGRTAIGSAVDASAVGPDADAFVKIAGVPPRLGTLTLADGKLSIALEAGTGATVDGKPATQATLLADNSGTPSVVAHGSVSFIVIERSGRHALRVRDSAAATRTGFVGMDYYDIDPSWRVEGRFLPHPDGKTIPIANVIGTLDDTPNPGAVEFERDGKQYRLEAVDGGPDQLWFIFSDRTSGKQTYGAGRFLYSDRPKPGSDLVVVDFNKSYNPPCVFTPYATCPLAPPENRLDLAVTAGELNYRGVVH